MWSFAIYLVSFLQAAFAKPVDWLDVSAAPNPVIPGRVEGIGNFGDIALDGGWETKAPSSDSNPTSEAPRMSRWRTLVSTELALSPEYVDSGVETTSNAESLAPYSVDILAELTPGDDVSRRPKLDWDSNPYFRVGSVIEMDKRHHLHYPDYDQGFTRFLCEAENLACCEIYESLELRFSKDEQPPYYVLCEKFEIGNPCSFDSIYCPIEKASTYYLMVPRCPQTFIEHSRSKVCKTHAEELPGDLLGG